MQANSLLTVAMTDPDQLATWSGTPRAINDAFRRLGYSVDGLAANDPRLLDRAIYTAFGIPFYGRRGRAFRPYYGPLSQRIRTRVAEARGAMPGKPFLHTDHMWLPFPGLSSHDYLYRDTSWSDYALNQGVGERLRRKVGRDLKLALEKVGHVFVTSQWAKECMIDEGAPPERVSVVGTGAGNFIEPYFGPKDYSNGSTLCIAKVRHHNKGIDLLLEGFALARRANANLTLDLVAPAGMFAKQDGVRFHSNLSAEALRQLYYESALYAMPARYEPWGLVYLEAQLASIPILGSNRAAFPELSDHGKSGFILERLTARAVADALVVAHSDPDGLHAMGQHARSYASTFSWDRTVRLMDAVMQKPALLT